MIQGFAAKLGEAGLNVLLVGSGGREHALAWALAASPLSDQALLRARQCRHRAGRGMRAHRGDGFRPALVAFAKEKRIDFAVIGADAPLVAGLWDRFEAAGIRALGPSKAAAVLEGSKGFVKDLCAENGIPTAAYRRFREPAAAKAFADTLGLPVVIKADGLAAGKGVIIAETQARTRHAPSTSCSKAASATAGAKSWSRNSWKARRRASSP